MHLVIGFFALLVSTGEMMTVIVRTVSRTFASFFIGNLIKPFKAINQLTLTLLQFVLYPSVPYGNVKLHLTSVLGLAYSSVV